MPTSTVIIFDLDELDELDEARLKITFGFCWTLHDKVKAANTVRMFGGADLSLGVIFVRTKGYASSQYSEYSLWTADA